MGTACPLLCLFLVLPVGRHTAHSQPSSPRTNALVSASKDPELNEDEARIVVLMRSDGAVLSEDLVIYPNASGTSWLIPLGQFAYQMEMALSVSPKKRVAQGFFYIEQNSFIFDAQKGVVQSAGIDAAVGSEMFVVARDDIFVDVRLLSQWFPLECTLNLFASTLTVKPLVKLPSQEAKDRELDAKLARSQGTIPGSLPKRDIERSNLQVGFLDQILSFRRSFPPDSFPRNEAEHRTVATGEIAGWDTRMEIAGVDRQIKRPRYSLVRREPQKTLLGPLHAEEIRLLDFYFPGLPLVGSVGEARGALVTNHAGDFFDEFGSRTIRGFAPPGYEAELYRNGIFIARVITDPAGTYEFRDVTLIYGSNQFRTILYGPQGQREERLETLDIDRSMVPTGDLRYHLGVSASEGQQSFYETRADLGLTQFLSVSGGVSRQPVLSSSQNNEDGQDETNLLHFGSVGIRAIAPHGVIFSDASSSNAKGRATQIGVRTPWPHVTGSLRRIWLNDWLSPSFGPDDRDLRVRTEGAIDVYGSWPVNIYAGFARQRDERQDEERTTDLTKVGMGIGRLYLGEEVTLHHTEDEPLEGKAIAGLYFDRHQARIETLHDRKRASQSTFRHEYYWSSQLHSTLETTRNYSDSESAFSAALLQSTRELAIGYGCSWTPSGIKLISLDLSYSLGVDTDHGKARASSSPMADKGAIAVQVFYDANNNGVLDGDEKPMKGARLRIEGRRTDQATGDDGWIWVAGLEPYRSHAIELDIESIEDPSMHPRESGFSFLPRPGITQHATIAVLATGEVEGVIWVEGEQGKKEPRGGIKVVVIDAHDKVIASTVNSSDGYYLIERIPPGRYRVRLDEKQLSSLGLRGKTGVRTLEIDHSRLSQTGFDFLIGTE